VGEEGEHEPVMLALAGEVSPPDIAALDHREQAGELAPVE
jgi:hypothetical protein